MLRLLATASLVALLAAAVATGPAGTTEPTPAPGAEASRPPDPFECGTTVTPQMKAMSWIEGKWTVAMTCWFPGRLSRRVGSLLRPGADLVQERGVRLPPEEVTVAAARRRPGSGA
jgi:hypothetical protein